MATSPHQPETLSDKITRLKADRARKQALLETIETIGSSTGGGGLSTTYPNRAEIQREIHQLDAIIESFVSQLNGTGVVQPGIGLLAFVGETPPYAYLTGS